MDRHLQERLVGAIVLVIIAVLVIPEFLSGPRKPQSITQGLELPADGDGDIKTVTIRMDRSSDTPQAAATTVENTPANPEPKKSEPAKPEPSKPKPASTEPKKAEAKTESKPQPTRTAAATSTDKSANKGGFAVQVGSFSPAGKCAASRQYVAPARLPDHGHRVPQPWPYPAPGARRAHDDTR